jgi:hypothetical protein
MAYSYVLKYNPHHPAGQRVIAEEHNSSAQTVLAISLKENKGFTYGLVGGLTNHDLVNQHFYVECPPGVGIAYLYYATKVLIHGQLEYVKTGGPILSSQ